MKKPVPLFSVAPMLDWTDRHCRYFLRLMSKKAFLYTEMITTGAILHGSTDRVLGFNWEEKPVALQLGGCDPHTLARCAKRGEDYGYDAINLNIGCPSPRVQQGRFGACLMREPHLVAECVSRINASVNIPVTIKTRIGVDNDDTEEQLHHFIETVSQAGCNTFIIHARKAWLKGLSPKENREVPPLRYDVVERVRIAFPHLHFILNGGIQTLEAAKRHTEIFSGIMLGRAVAQQPYLLSQVDAFFYHEKENLCSREKILTVYMDYARQQYKKGVPVSILSRPLMGFYQGLSGAKKWRRELNSFFELNFKGNVNAHINSRL